MSAPSFFSTGFSSMLVVQGAKCYVPPPSSIWSRKGNSAKTKKELLNQIRTNLHTLLLPSVKTASPPTLSTVFGCDVVGGKCWQCREWLIDRNVRGGGLVRRYSIPPPCASTIFRCIVVGHARGEKLRLSKVWMISRELIDGKSREDTIYGSC